MTTPLVTTLYPPQYRVRASGTGSNFNNVGDGERDAGRNEGSSKLRSSSEDWEDAWKRRFTVVLDKIDHLPGMIAFTRLITAPAATSSEDVTSSTNRRPTGKRYSIGAIRLIELSDHFSSVMKSSAANTQAH